jgi:cytochrome c peroxidase
MLRPGGRPDSASSPSARRLFFDTRMSLGGNRSCSTCHQPERAFTEGLARSTPISTSPHALLRNAPTLINSGLQTASFYDLRTETLEGQVGEVVRNRDEMHGDSAVSNEVRRRRRLYPLAHVAGQPVRPVRRGGCTAVYQRGTARLPPVHGQGLCGTCHFAPLFNGAVPPATYTQTESEVIGVPSRAVTSNQHRPRPQALRHPAAPHQRHAFKTPTLRNIELTAPYMHGVYGTLERCWISTIVLWCGSEVLPNRRCPSTAGPDYGGQRAIITFLRTLTDTTGLTGRQLTVTVATTRQ